MILTHSNNHPISVETFVAAWITWVKRYHTQASWQTFCMPRLNTKEILAVTLRNGRAGSLDVMLRLLAPVAYRNAMQATNPFMAANTKWLDRCPAISPKRQNVQGAKLTKAALSVWSNLGSKKQSALIANVKTIVEAYTDVAKDKKSETTKLTQKPMTTLIDCIIASVWEEISIIRKTYKTPSGVLFTVRTEDSDSITIETTGGTRITILRKQFHEALKYLIENSHFGRDASCEIRADRTKPGLLNRATSSLRNGTVVIPYILPMLASTGIVGIDGKRPNTTWVNL